MKKIILLTAALLSGLAVMAQGTRLEKSTPEMMGMSSEKLSQIDNVIEEAIKDTLIPGAVVCVVRKDKVVFLKAYGNKAIYPKKEKMTENTVFDLASCSKCVGTTLSFMQLIESGKVRLIDRVDMYIPDFEPYIDEDGKKIHIRIIDLLTHTSGLPAYVNPSEVEKECGKADAESLIKWISHCKRVYKPANGHVYSCLNFITLQNVLQNVTGMKLCDYAQQNVFDRLGLKYTTYSPKAQKKKDIMKLVAPTEKQPDGKCLLGEVHDPLARVCGGGNSGNAGVFSNAEDLAVICAALLNGGEYDGKRILGPLTVKAMRTVPREVRRFGRTLGWDNDVHYYTAGDLFSEETYGHTGYTGPSIVIDPQTKTAVIILANRVHPYDTGGLARQRATIGSIVAGSILMPSL
ncbi:MAG: serine hydrolase [Bacteroidales bacterium]|nr:serine hydrolase [Bacteroidales bacterium]